MSSKHRLIRQILLMVVCGFLILGKSSNELSLAQSTLADPRDIVDNVLWLDASDLDGDFKPGGDFVDSTRWMDKSTAKNANARQDNSANRPTLVAHGLNELSVLRFDGNDFMDIDPAAFNMLSNVQGATLFAVVKTDSNSGQRLLMIATNRSAATRAGLNLFDEFGMNIAGKGNFGIAGRRLDVDPFQRIEGGTTTLGQFYQYTGVLDYAHSAVTLYVSGKPETTTSNFQSAGATSPTPSQNIRIGADADLTALRGTFRGDIAELIVYRRALAPEEREKIEAYLHKKWLQPRSLN